MSRFIVLFLVSLGVVVTCRPSPPVMKVKEAKKDTNHRPQRRHSGFKTKQDNTNPKIPQTTKVRAWGCEGARVWGCKGVRVWGCEGVRVRGCEGVRAWGCEGVRVRGCEGVRMCGYEGVRVWGREGAARRDTMLQCSSKQHRNNENYTSTIKYVLLRCCHSSLPNAVIVAPFKHGMIAYQYYLVSITPFGPSIQETKFV